MKKSVALVSAAVLAIGMLAASAANAASGRHHHSHSHSHHHGKRAAAK